MSPADSAPSVRPINPLNWHRYDNGHALKPVKTRDTTKPPEQPIRDRFRLWVIWLLSAGLIIIWLRLDHRMPAWDQGDALIGSVNFWWTLKHAQWFSGDWWEQLWMLSSKYPPFLYIVTGFWQMLIGVGPDRAASINILFLGILLASTYGLGRCLFNRVVGIWAAIIVVLLPGLYTLNLDYLFDYPLVAMVAASYYSLTRWKLSRTRWQGYRWAFIFGVLFGLTCLTKQTGVFFFIVPLLWLGIARLWQRRWEAILQLLIGLAITLLIVWPWVHTNWIFFASTWQSANVGSAVKEGDPAVNTIGAWIYYVQRLPQTVSWPLLLVPIVGSLLTASGLLKKSARELKRAKRQGQSSLDTTNSFLWIGGFLAGAYLFWSAISNKDLRYIAPYLSVLSVCLAAGLLIWPRRYLLLRWFTLILSVMLMLCNLFPLGGGVGQWLTQQLTPGSQFQIVTQTDWPQAAIVQRILGVAPYQLSTVGVLPAKPWLNQYNITYAGELDNFQVYGRNLGRGDRQRQQDLDNTQWFISLTNPQQADIPLENLESWERNGHLLASDPNFQVELTWRSAADQQVSLYRRRQLPIVVEPLLQPNQSDEPVQLQQVTLPASTPPGQPVPVTYVWEGEWQRLRTGQVLLTWIPQDSDAPANSEAQADAALETYNRAANQTWLHDHGIGLGTLRPGPIQAHQSTLSPPIVSDQRWFRVTERTAMQPPVTLEPGRYTLQASYLEPSSGTITPLTVPAISLQVDPAATPSPAPPLDYVTQVRELAKQMPSGISGVETIFSTLDRLNLYDPIQNFYVQAEVTLEARFQQAADNLDYAYGILLSRILQRKVNASLAILDRIVALDPQNPYGYAYQALVNLVDWRPGMAKESLEPALASLPDSPELTAMQAIANLMQGNLMGAWQWGQKAIDLSNS